MNACVFVYRVQKGMEIVTRQVFKLTLYTCAAESGVSFGETHQAVTWTVVWLSLYTDVAESGVL